MNPLDFFPPLLISERDCFSFSPYMGDVVSTTPLYLTDSCAVSCFNLYKSRGTLCSSSGSYWLCSLHCIVVFIWCLSVILLLLRNVFFFCFISVLTQPMKLLPAKKTNKSRVWFISLHRTSFHWPLLCVILYSELLAAYRNWRQWLMN